MLMVVCVMLSPLRASGSKVGDISRRHLHVQRDTRICAAVPTASGSVVKSHRRHDVPLMTVRYS
jgi:hypothetical protein